MTIPRNLSFLAEGASSTGVLRTANGGTALTSFTANGILYASSSSVLATGSGLQFDGTNLAIGITPASWYATNSRAFQVGSSTSIFDYSASGNRQTGLLNNAYLNASGVYTYLNTDPASRYHQTGGQHYWYTAPSSSGAITWTQSLFISNAGGVSIGNTTDPGATNLSVTGTGKFGTTVSVGAATPSASGAGITFPATQSASTDANTLDDYEEGTWTPTDASGAGLTVSITYATYTKIGNTVFARAYVDYPANVSAANAILTLPFTSANTVIGSGLSSTASNMACCLSTAGLAQITFRNSTFVNITNASLSGATILFSVSYTV